MDPDLDLETIVKTAPLEAAWEKLKQLPTPYTNQPLNNYSTKIYSQNKEDGIIFRIFAEIGTTSKKILEIGAGDGIECMAANLILNHGFTGTLIDGSEYWLQSGSAKYQEKDPALLETTRFVLAWVTRDNVVEIIKGLGLALGQQEGQEGQEGQDLDMFSLDVDGVDYYILKAIMDAKVIRPRLMVLEYQDILGPTATLTVAYDPAFDHHKFDCWGGPNYCGASLGAFIHLLKADYAFVGCEDQGFNAFFVRRDCLTPNLVEMTDVTPCFEIPKVVDGMRNRAPRTAALEWIDVKTLV